MISAKAREDWEDLKARGFSPTLEDFDRLNSIALRMTDGAETTAANFPRVGWAGDVPFYQPTYAAFAWYLTYAERLADSAEKDAAWFYALAHAREHGAFSGLVARARINQVVNEWISKLPVTMDEVRRACRYAASGFDDAVAGKGEREKELTADEQREKNLNALHERLVEAAAVAGIPPSELERETPLTIRELTRLARERSGEKLGLDRSAAKYDYDMTYREIYHRLEAEKKAKEAANG